ncbi:Tryptophan synthase alpha chain [Labilithrix luteola]|uniref:Tryptophan synthase alpha chain n=1 Tax=Labilithrix luteola TaxID=1391654 RepID=A0A0K1QFB0_9BACT|nr:hypothetical protein [Labilithrix luteola]AKV04461.1 Tryptophan synthase alpha chain [Labilithrix luteola]
MRRSRSQPASLASVLLFLAACSAACSGSSDGGVDDTSPTGTEAGAGNSPSNECTANCEPDGGLAPAASCLKDSDCSTDYCDFDCKAPPPNVHSDGRRNGGETGVDCGGTADVACANGQGCKTDSDCTGDYCDGTMCAPAPDNVHSDGRRNGGETGVDCGGAAPTDCAAGGACKTNDDCLGLCNELFVCTAPSPTDGKKNADETDVDCGGATADKCKLTKTCIADTDCALGYCKDSKCATPAVDGVKNGAETDVDCGGGTVTEDAVSYTAPRCKDDGLCAVDSDCVTSACSPGGVCVAPSCDTAETAGIVTCGSGEVGDAAKVHETCCRSLVLPTRTTRRLDRYEITAGRMRTFVDAVGPDVRSWVNAYITAHPTSPLDATVPSQLAKLKTMDAEAIGFFPAQLHGAEFNLVSAFALDADPYDGIRGCYNGAGSYGANTYWQEPTNLADYGIPARTIARSESDQKSMNCAMPIMFMAFCAWDGGELALLADHNDAWPTTQAYPWGTTDIKRPNYNWCNGGYKTGGFTCQDTTTFPATAQTIAGVFYEWPRGQDPANDEEIWIAAPGRFPNDATSRKSVTKNLPWQDLYANLGEYTGDLAAPTPTGTDALQKGDFCDFTAGTVAGGTSCTDSKKPGQTGTYFKGVPTVKMSGHNTWEGHTGRNGTYVATFQYGKFGARCVRAAQ